VRKLVEEVPFLRAQHHGPYAWNKSNMPRAHFIRNSRGKEGNLRWIKGRNRGAPPVERCARALRAAIRREEAAEAARAAGSCRHPDQDLKEITARCSTGEAKARRAKREMTEANLRLVISIAKKYTNRGLQFPRPDPGREHRLMKAVDKFEYRRGYKVLDLATW